MLRIEQAVFTSIKDDCAAGYAVVARSPGVCDDDARELAAWGPSHDSMLDPSPAAESFNFHPLPSGASCISRSVPLGGQCHAGGQRVYTQCLIVPPDVLLRFGNNPFSLIHAAAADGLWQVDNEVGQVGNLSHASRLEPLTLTAGGAAPVDQALLAMLAADPGPENMAVLVQSARDAVCLALACRPSPTPLIAGFFSCLPPECRLEFSFSTGLKFSPRRPFRIVALSGDPAERCWIANYANVAVLELRGGKAPLPTPLDGWARLIRQTISTGHIPFLAAQVSKRRFHLTPADLPALGLQLLEGMESLDITNYAEAVGTTDENLPPSAQRADAAHRRIGKGIEIAPAANEKGVRSNLPERPSGCFAQIGPDPFFAHLDPSSPEVLEKLEHLDDLVYEAIGGQAESLEQLQAAWPKLADELGEELLAESREQYLRYALSIWDECAHADGVRQPARAIRALDVLCLLFGDAT